RAAFRHVLLASERERTVAPSPRLHMDPRLVVEHLRLRGADRLRGVDDRDEAALAARAELRLAVAHGEDRVVLAELRARARPEPGAALADDDLAGAHVLPGEDLDAEVLRVRVAPVLRRAESLLVRHYPASPSSLAPSSSSFFSADSRAETAPFR